jgi:hypothetical protein
MMKTSRIPSERKLRKVDMVVTYAVRARAIT